MIHWQRMMFGFMHAFMRLCVRSCVHSCMHVTTFMLECGNTLVNWPTFLGPFQNSFTTFFNVYMFGMSFYITSSIKKLHINFFIVF